ncbi:Dihydroneopterin aldolase / delta 1-pyrroline-5-carboxylate synthetase [Roseibacterium elongatum DSM 19469]|uniref:dihydroneopterin aldolase n=1 Tax=Roseicyclus elongatus DSM 19469 TaxID=1294273 RepID=W8S5Z8_9RHOB|nr:dihydroneopterin aldolase [Roseibacterium elongatum]AHM05667.1 Dihydroneopterin aldolase / delta 1-pyrroline-5-carboxylate synthetase [Roseibacterium elongatum DSM 19469]
MSDETSIAFQHPSERAKSIAGDVPRDRISMTEHLREVEIGAFQAERGVTQTVRFDVVVEVATRAESAADDVDRILSYDTIVESIDAALAAERVNLLETLAARIADGILAHPLAARVFVRIGKLDRGPYTLGVEIMRDAPEGRRPLRLLADAAPHPVVVFLSNAAIARPDLSVLLDDLQSGGAPVILCVDCPDLPQPRAAHAMPQRRIDLLAIEQGAWVLAARDRRCVVVDSRTELDWAMRHGQISVWAPSKLVLDAVDGPGPGVTHPVALAMWLATAFDAREVISLGGTLPADTPRPPMPLRELAAEALPSETAPPLSEASGATR